MMNRTRAILPVVALTFLGCQAAAPTASPGAVAFDDTAVAEGPQAVLWVKGIACPYCIPNIDRPLRRLSGVTDVRVELETGRVVVRLSSGEMPSEADLRAAVDKSGFTLERIEMP